MQLTERAILLHKIKYGDSGLILKLLTKNFGKRSYLLQGLKGKNKSVVSILHPLAAIEIVVYSSRSSSLGRIKEINIQEPFHSIRSDFYKNSLAFFIAETLLKSLPDEEAQPDLFNFVNAAISLLESSHRVANFHLIFLVKLSQFLGFYPQGIFTNREFFDLENGIFTRLRPSHLNYIEKIEAKKLSEILNLGFDYMSESVPRTERAVLLDSLMKYYRYHLDGFGTLKSIQVIRELND